MPSPESPIFTLAELHAMRCHACGKEHPTVMNAGCHLHAPLFIFFDHELELMIAACAVCKSFVGAFQIADPKPGVEEKLQARPELFGSHGEET